MCDGFNRGVLRVSVAQICQSMGWDSVQRSTHDLLTDVLQKYLEEIGKSAYGYSQLYCRTEPNLDDLGLAFEDVGIPLRELEDYATQVEQAPFLHQLPRYPKLKANALHHPRNGEIVDRLEYYHEHLPPLIKVLHGNEDADETTADSDQADRVLQEVDVTKNGIKTVGEETPIICVAVKRPLEESPPGPENDAKRRRLESMCKYNSSKNENGMDILQALQGDISSPSPTPSPTAVISFEDKLLEVSHTLEVPPVHKAGGSLALPLKKDKVKEEGEPAKKVPTTKASPKKTKSTSDPKVGSSAKTPESPKSQVKSSTKSPKTVKEKNKTPPLKSPPEKSPTPPPKQPTSTSSANLPASPRTTPKQKSADKSPSSGATKKVKKPVSAAKSRPVTTSAVVSSDVKKEDPSPSPAMPKLIIKPIKQEPGTEIKQPVAEPVFSMTSQPSDVPNKKKTKTKQGSVTANTTKETRITQPVKLEAPDTVPAPRNAPLKFMLSQFLASSSPSPSNVAVNSDTEPFPEHKKKKKKHKEKDKEKKHKKPSSQSSYSDEGPRVETSVKIKKEPVEPVSAGFSGIPPIPRLKLKLDAGHPTTSTSVKQEGNLPSNKTSADYSGSRAVGPAIGKPDRRHPPTVGDLYKSEAVERTVRTQTLSTTVMSDSRVYICPACHLPDDGSFMIGCDSCDEWFHGACVGILKDPGDGMDWFCTVCKAKSEKSKKKKKKKSKEKTK